MILSLNTSYYDKGKHITDRIKIVKNYFKTSFLSEIIGCISVVAYLIN